MHLLLMHYDCASGAQWAEVAAFFGRSSLSLTCLRLLPVLDHVQPLPRHPLQSLMPVGVHAVAVVAM
jgi:hypothetical protein